MLGLRRMKPRKIIIAYNAEAGLFGAAKNWASKVLWPDLNPCTLCRITHDVRGNFTRGKSISNPSAGRNALLLLQYADSKLLR